MSQIIIETSNLSKTYKGNIEALKSLNLKIFTGESVGYVGPNGAGKTTTIQILLNLIRPSSGEVTLFGKKMNGYSKENLKRIGALVEIPGFYDFLSPDQILKHICKIYRVEKSKIDVQIANTLATMKLTEVRFEKISSFSTGMRRRLAIAQVLVHGPDLILLDEPTIGLDPKGVREVRDIIKNLHKSGKTIFISSHNLTEVSEIADRVLFLNKGEIIEDTNMDALHDRIQSRRIEVKFKVNPSDVLTNQINSLDGVIDVQIGKTSYIEFSEVKQDPESILKEMINMGLSITSFTPQTMTLEDLYLQLYEKEETLR
ncbi:MAG: ABC transporter ATP-binding protein [Candidatus Heimdallarchaeota archaeon]|nr:ABC transporter ATP-binding protein [Candidatus Heimdallarchaeota archaeon]